MSGRTVLLLLCAVVFVGAPIVVGVIFALDGNASMAAVCFGAAVFWLIISILVARKQRHGAR